MRKKIKVDSFMGRQGDVLIMRVDDNTPLGKELPRGNDGRVVLALGEATGHAHAISSIQCSLYMDERRPISETDAANMIAQLGGGLIPDRLLKCDETVELLHEEHEIIILPKGTYRVSIQKEYSPSALRNVTD